MEGNTGQVTTATAKKQRFANQRGNLAGLWQKGGENVNLCRHKVRGYNSTCYFTQLGCIGQQTVGLLGRLPIPLLQAIALELAVERGPTDPQ